jgi:hypothetical protein
MDEPESTTALLMSGHKLSRDAQAVVRKASRIKANKCKARVADRPTSAQSGSVGKSTEKCGLVVKTGDPDDL